MVFIPSVLKECHKKESDSQKEKQHALSSQIYMSKREGRQIQLNKKRKTIVIAKIWALILHDKNI